MICYYTKAIIKYLMKYVMLFEFREFIKFSTIYSITNYTMVIDFRGVCCKTVDLFIKFISEIVC